MIRICRACLGTEESSDFKEIDQEVTSNLEFVCGITPIDHQEILGVALICSSCSQNLSNAATFKKVALLAEIFFKKRVEEYVKEDCSDDGDLESLIEYEEYIEDEDQLEFVIESATQETPLDENPPVSANRHARESRVQSKEHLDSQAKIQRNSSTTKQKFIDPCSICGKVLSSQVALKNHEDKHYVDSQPNRQEKKFICDFCGQSFRLKSYIFNHMNNMHIRNRKYPCSYCERNFYKKFELNDHIRQQHTLETPFRCEFEGCSKSFSRKKNYLIHKRIHTNERPYSCSFLGCDRAFIHYIDKKRHLLKHTGDRPFQCTQAGCSKSFLRQSELRAHQKSH